MSRRRPALAAAFLAVPLVAGTFAALSATTGTAPPAPIPLKVLYVRLTSFAPLAIARDEGFFRAQGLDVELVEIPGLDEATPR